VTPARGPGHLARRAFVASLVAGGAAGAVGAASVAAAQGDDPMTSQPPPGVVVLSGAGIDATGDANSSEGLQGAIDRAGDGTRLWLPAGTYLVDGLVLRPGQALSGPLARSYQGSPGHGARLRARLATQTEPVLVVGEYGHLSDLSVEGNGRNQPAVRPGGFGVVLDRVTLLGGSVGYDAAYTSGAVISGCQVHENGIGIANPVDSIVQGTLVNANSGDGIALGPGANDNVFQGNKIEWNDGHGLRADRAEHNVVVGGIVDRNGGAGLWLRECVHTAVVGCVLRRNGRLAERSPEDDCHLYQQDCAGLVVTGVVTNSGGDDDGGGHVSPSVAVRQRGGTDVSVAVNDLTGATASAMDDDSADRGATLLNLGVAGVQTVSAARVRVGAVDLDVAPDRTVSADFAVGPVARGGAGSLFRLLLAVRDRSSGARAAAEVLLLISRDSGAAEVAVGAVADRIGRGTANRFAVRATVSPDGSQLSITVRNTGTTAANVRLDLV
jgi:hypothetical protein